MFALRILSTLRMYSVVACCTSVMGYVHGESKSDTHGVLLVNYMHGLSVIILIIQRWHVFSGYGTYVQLVTGHYIRFLALKKKNVELVYYGFIPVIRVAKNVKKVKAAAKSKKQ